MRVSVSNLAWPDPPSESTLTALRNLGVEALEIAPTMIWAQAPDIARVDAARYSARLRDSDLAVSGIQSLLFGHPELQLFQRESWPEMRTHLSRMIDIAGALTANVAVFGSPRNRIKGSLSLEEAMEIASEFLTSLTGVLEENGVVLTMEPNAPGYGADFVTDYDSSVELCSRVGSAWVQPQVDTGCLSMAGDDPTAAVDHRLPAHVHVSEPNLTPPPASVDHASVAAVLRDREYTGWTVLEMLPPPGGTGEVLDCAAWLVETYGSSK